MQDPTALQPAVWRQRLHQLRLNARSIVLFGGGIFMTLLTLLLYNTLFPGPSPLTTQEINASIADALASVTPAPAYSAQVYQIIRPSLVFIHVDVINKAGEPDTGLGSGVIVNDSGAILTSLHVVADATAISVIFADGTESEAAIIVAQPENDMALLQPAGLPEIVVPAVLGNPNAMRVGDEAFAVGHPLGLYGSMSAGVISGFDRSFQPEDSEQRLEGLIQFDAAVNPGNSGGPLLNRYGQVIGIVTGLVNPTEQEVFIGIGFAVPITTAAAAGGLPPY
jgi:S1-C subfamily serine protease